MRIWWQCQLGLVSLFFSVPALAQIVPDSSVGTRVTPNVTINGVPNDRIDGGAIRGANLFHSFSDFNIQAGQGAYFTNPAGITNIFSRVTGANSSNINGTLGVLGNANLFFLNPNGIIFGPGAQLDLNGSFLATTANSINFADGTNFSASNPQAAPLLTVSLPVGLGLGSNPGPIQVQGMGQNLTSSVIFTPFIGAGTITTGLRVQPGQTLALVGGDLALTGGILTAPQGRIELGSGAGGVVSLNPTNQGWTLSYGGVQSFRDIQLSQQALVDASGVEGGEIQLVGRQIVFTDGSIALSQNQGLQPGGNISLKASESLQLQSFSEVASETVGGGKGGDVITSTPQLTLLDGSDIYTLAFGAGSGGNITVNANSIQLAGFAADSPAYLSAIAAVNYGSGRGGDVTLSTGRLTLLEGAYVAGVTLGTGASGDVKVNATDAINVIGVEPGFLTPSGVISTSFNTGNAGSVTINTSKLAIRDGGNIEAATGGTGNAGSVTINASDSVEVSGTVPGTLLPSLVSSSAVIVDPAALQLYGFPPGVSGGSGDITINTGRLSVTNGALIDVRNDGTGNGGMARVNARSITLDHQGSISATAASGEGGIIALQTQDLQLRHGSHITATAGGTGNGGNITIGTDTLVALENSNITANAFQGRGGNIQITTQGIFLSHDSSITASSQLGISGSVNFNTLDLNQQQALVATPSNFTSADQVVADSCLTHNNARQGKFVVTGNGGLPETPDEALVVPYDLAQVRAIDRRQAAARRRNSLTAPQFSPWKLGDPIVEATEFAVNADGKVVLTASAAKAIAEPPALTCQVN